MITYEGNFAQIFFIEFSIEHRAVDELIIEMSDHTD